MRLAVLTSLFPNRSFPVEGIFAERRWRGMAARGHDVRVIHPLPRTPWPLVRGRWAALHGVSASERRGALLLHHPRYLHVPRLALSNARRFARAGVDALLGAGRPDAVVCDYAWPAAAAAPLLRARDIPCIVSGRGSDVLQVAGEAGLAEHLARFLRAAEHWCAVSQHLLGVMDELGGGSGTLVPNGVDLELFRIQDAGRARAELGVEPGVPLVLVVGHLIARKDPELALAAFASGAPSGARLAFVGKGPLLPALERRARELGLPACVAFVGEETPERLALWYAAADCLLLTSRREGRPNVVLEALACGLPVVATDAGGTVELLRGEPGLCVSGEGSRDPAVVGVRLREVLAAPPAPERLRELVLPYSWEQSLDALEGCIARAIGAGEPRSARDARTPGKVGR